MVCKASCPYGAPLERFESAAIHLSLQMLGGAVGTAALFYLAGREEVMAPAVIGGSLAAAQAGYHMLVHFLISSDEKGFPVPSLLNGGLFTIVALIVTNYALDFFELKVTNAEFGKIIGVAFGAICLTNKLILLRENPL